MLEMTNICKVFRTELVETRALSEFSLTVGQGEFVTITGPSGCGKSHLIHAIGGALITAGQQVAYSPGAQLNRSFQKAPDRRDFLRHFEDRQISCSRRAGRPENSPPKLFPTRSFLAAAGPLQRIWRFPWKTSRP